MKHIVNIFFNHTGEIQLTKNDNRVFYKLGTRVKIGNNVVQITLDDQSNPIATVDGKPGVLEPISDNEHGFGFRLDIPVEPVMSMTEWAAKFAPGKKAA
jgi:hypothetical protein